MEPVRLWLLIVFLSPVSFLILLPQRWRLRQLLFLPLAAAPPALLLYVQTREIMHGYDEVYYFVFSMLLSGAFLLLGCALVFRARGQRKGAILTTALSTLLAAVPLLFVAAAMIYYRLVADAG